MNTMKNLDDHFDEENKSKYGETCTDNSPVKNDTSDRMIHHSETFEIENARPPQKNHTSIFSN